MSLVIGWPRLTWVVTEHLSKPAKDWKPPARLTDDSTCYVEYTTDQEGSVKGVTVSRSAQLAHARALTAACRYAPGQVLVSVLDYKREVGLWHSITAVCF